MTRKITTLENIIHFQHALISLYETEYEKRVIGDGTDRFNLFRDSYKSTIKTLKKEYEKL